MKVTLIGTHLGARIRKDGMKQFEGLCGGVDTLFADDFLNAAIHELQRIRKSLYQAEPELGSSVIDARLGFIQSSPKAGKRLGDNHGKSIIENRQGRQNDR